MSKYDTRFYDAVQSLRELSAVLVEADVTSDEVQELVRIGYDHDPEQFHSVADAMMLRLVDVYAPDHLSKPLLAIVAEAERAGKMWYA